MTLVFRALQPAATGDFTPNGHRWTTATLQKKRAGALCASFDLIGAAAFNRRGPRLRLSIIDALITYDVHQLQGSAYGDRNLPGNIA